MKLYWLDLETTGLDPHTDGILEVAIAEADFKDPFNIKFVYERVFYHPYLTHRRHLAETPSQFVRDMHTKNGLWAECAQSHHDVRVADLELRDLINAVDNNILAGSSIHFDHEFIKVHMPMTAAAFSHRHYDVSAIKLFCQSQGMDGFTNKGSAHRAMEDIIESVEHAKLCQNWLMHH